MEIDRTKVLRGSRLEQGRTCRVFFEKIVALVAVLRRYLGGSILSL